MKTPFLVVPIPVARVSMHEGKVVLVLVGASRLHGGQRPITPQGSNKTRKVQFFLTLFKKPLAPPPHSFEHYVVNFSEGILTKVRKLLVQQLSTKKHVNLW